MIRELCKEDKETFAKMVKSLYSGEAVLYPISDDNIDKTFKEVISGSPYVKAYIIECDNEMAGYALISLTYSNEAGGIVVIIDELYIDDKYRGKGLGTELLKFIEEKYSNKVKRYRLEVSNENEAAEKLYLRIGYEVLDYKQLVKDIAN